MSCCVGREFCQSVPGYWQSETNYAPPSLELPAATEFAEGVDAAVPDDPTFLLSVHAEGPATEDGHLPLAELARIAGGLQLTLERIALALTGSYFARGRRPREIVEAVRLDFAGFRDGSVIIDTIRPGRGGTPADASDLLTESIRVLEAGVDAVRRHEQLPAYFTPHVLNGLRELAGGINSGNLTRISFSRPQGHQFVIDPAFRDELQRVAARADDEQEATVVGRLQMGDFSPAALRCRIDTFAGSVLADFGADLRDAVLDAMDQLVMATGTAELQPDGSTVRLLHLSAIEILPSARLSPLATLERQQGTAPVGDIEELLGPETVEDFGPFLEAIKSARRGDG
jgi:hypothetical protein